MPTYDYRCDNCAHEMEAFQSITARPLRKCPECGRQTLKRLIGTGAGVIFKGSGFYETDYKRKGEQKKETQGQQSESGGQQSGESSGAGDSQSGSGSGGDSSGGSSSSDSSSGGQSDSSSSSSGGKNSDGSGSSNKSDA